ncbi:uncharacterized protein si:ch211-51e12.7 isoform X5 [Pseudoliparis swirei]|uniref:uncharacterized protein si:ch211-51e12.7 isoform X5 n=1 Tax=Pseudoliparis swirei TaxID=2059687 RepID=UPI0024BD7883|nr:uncharacterized protein si:ch211-51e12.7 isoform X5 [Pseudoliparis swirei]
MDGDTEKKVTESSKNPKEESQRPLMDHTFRGHGFKSRGGGGRIGRGGMRGGRGMMKGFEPPGYGRGRSKEGAMNGFTPMRGMRRMRPYPDPRNHRGTDPMHPLLQDILVSEGLHHTLEAVACCFLDLHATSTTAAKEVSTMDRSLLLLLLLLLTLHLVEARGGQGPLVADAFNTACPENKTQTLDHVEGA